MSELEQALRDEVAHRRERIVELAAELVRVPSVLGDEAPALAIVDRFLSEAGFDVSRVEPDAEAALADPTAGYPPLPYAGRACVVGRLAGMGGGRSMHLSGHIDVVPVERAERWTHAPWAGEIADGRLWGRGAADMKAGLAAYLVAAEVVGELVPERRGDLIASAVFEEECTGNGMWAVLQAGHVGDALLIGESTGLRVGHAATGVVWARVAAPGGTGHSMLASGSGPFEQLAAAIAAMREVETAINTPVQDPIFGAVRERPFGMTVGKLEGGVWTASTPAELAAHIRFGFGRDNTPQRIQERLRDAVARAAPDVDLEFYAFRAHAHANPTDGPLADTLTAAHRDVLGEEPSFSAATGTNDGRYIDGPSLNYGPIAGNLHGDDEWVDIDSLVATASVIAVATARFTA
jgi:acetylornithine deacetylase